MLLQKSSCYQHFFSEFLQADIVLSSRMRNPLRKSFARRTRAWRLRPGRNWRGRWNGCCRRSEDHTSELQSLRQLVCRPLLEKNPAAEVTRFAIPAADLTQHESHLADAR